MNQTHTIEFTEHELDCLHDALVIAARTGWMICADDVISVLKDKVVERKQAAVADDDHHVQSTE